MTRRSFEQYERVYRRCEGECWICAEPVPFDYGQLDHLVPRHVFTVYPEVLSDAGLPLKTFDFEGDENLSLAHHICNTRRPRWHYSEEARRDRSKEIEEDIRRAFEEIAWACLDARLDDMMEQFKETLA